MDLLPSFTWLVCRCRWRARSEPGPFEDVDDLVVHGRERIERAVADGDDLVAGAGAEDEDVAVEAEPPAAPPSTGDDGPKVVSLDQFRKK